YSRMRTRLWLSGGMRNRLRLADVDGRQRRLRQQRRRVEGNRDSRGGRARQEFGHSHSGLFTSHLFEPVISSWARSAEAAETLTDSPDPMRDNGEERSCEPHAGSWTE